MNTRQLLAELEKMGVNEHIYHVPGKVSEGYLADEGIYLQRSGLRWVIGEWNRGVEKQLATFVSEDKACRYVLDALTPHTKPGPVVRMTAEESEAAWARSQERMAELEAEGTEQKARYDAEQALRLGKATGETVEYYMARKGEVWDGFGSPKAAKHFSPDGTPYQERSLPPGYLGDGYHRYWWVRAFESAVGAVEMSVVAPAFGQPGGGLQFHTARTAMELIDAGYLVEIVE